MLTPLNTTLLYTVIMDKNCAELCGMSTHILVVNIESLGPGIKHKSKVELNQVYTCTHEIGSHDPPHKFRSPSPQPHVKVKGLVITKPFNEAFSFLCKVKGHSYIARYKFSPF